MRRQKISKKPQNNVYQKTHFDAIKKLSTSLEVLVFFHDENQAGHILDILKT